MFEEIKYQFEKVISHSQGIPDHLMNVEELFDQWLEAKRDIIEAFDGKLIYEVSEPVHFHLDTKVRQRNFEDFVQCIQSVYNNPELADFLASQDISGFFDNSVTTKYENVDTKIPVGMKLVKAFKYFEKDQPLLDRLQQHASRVIQEDKIEGKLCFSVHPLDYLSVSANTYNWRSCHALDGEYCAGNLSYMLDKSTIVCYLKGSDNEILPMFPTEVPWNSKKWRVLVYLSENWDMLMAGRQYPFSTMSGLDTTLKYLLPALKLNDAYFTSWKNDYVNHYQDKKDCWHELNVMYIPIRKRLYDFNDIVEDAPNSLQFNDLLRSSTYHEPFYSIKNNCGWLFSEQEPSKFIIGHEVPCLCCRGARRVRDGSMMVCRECADQHSLYVDGENTICDCCGSRVFYDDSWYDVQGETVCERCYERECFCCESCEEYYFNDAQRYDRENERYICVNCYENM